MNYKNAIIYISLSIIMSSIVYGIHFSNNVAAIILAVIFFGISFLYLYTTLNKDILTFLVCVVLFFFIGIANNYIYYNCCNGYNNKNFNGLVRITKKFTYSYIGEYNGKNIYLTGNLPEASIGEVFFIKGEFSKNIDIEYGNIGEVKVKYASKSKDDFITSIYKLRLKLYNNIKNNLGKRKAALISSLSYGYSDYLDEEDKEDMRNLGVIHAISVSGLHVALIYEITQKVLGKKLSVIITLVYVIFTGSAFSSLRAFIMIFLKVFAIEFRKKYNAMGALCFSSIVITIYKPYAVFNLGFILSFLAILGIILFLNNIDKKLFKLPSFLRETISMTISSAIFTTPILIYNFEKVSLVSLIGNLIIVPILTIIIKIGNLLILFTNCNRIFDFLCYILLKIINVLDYIVEKLYYFNSSVFVNKQMFIVYCLFLISIYFYKKGYKKSIYMVISAIIGFFITIYSPIIKLKYINEGAILISYKGDRRIICNSENYKENESKKKNLAYDVTRKCSKVKIKDAIIISEEDNYVLHIGNKKYLLKISDKVTKDIKYDIIDFVNGNTNEVYVLSKAVICIK